MNKQAHFPMGLRNPGGCLFRCKRLEPGQHIATHIVEFEMFADNLPGADLFERFESRCLKLHTLQACPSRGGNATKVISSPFSL